MPSPRNVFHGFDSHWHENFSSAVLAVAFKSSPHFANGLLRLIRERAGSPARSAAEAPSSRYGVSREASFALRHNGRTVRGRFDLLFTSGQRAIAIENKVGAELTREQLTNQRLALRILAPTSLLCALTMYDEPHMGEDVTLRWSDLAKLLPAPDGRQSRLVGQRVVADMRTYFGGLDMSFRGFGGQGVYETHRQRRILLGLLVDRLRGRLEPAWYDSRPLESDYFYQCARFRDQHGGVDRYLGFYDYQLEDRTALELYPDEPSEEPLDALSWVQVQRAFPLGRCDHKPAIDRLAARFDSQLKGLAPARRPKSRRPRP